MSIVKLVQKYGNSISKIPKIQIDKYDEVIVSTNFIHDHDDVCNI